MFRVNHHFGSLSVIYSLTQRKDLPMALGGDIETDEDWELYQLISGLIPAHRASPLAAPRSAEGQAAHNGCNDRIVNKE